MVRLVTLTSVCTVCDQEEKHEADKKLKEEKKQDFQQQEKKTPTKEFWKQVNTDRQTQVFNTSLTYSHSWV